jgi:hypothetical protein
VGSSVVWTIRRIGNFWPYTDSHDAMKIHDSSIVLKIGTRWDWSSSCPGRFARRKSDPGTQWDRRMTPVLNGIG